MAKSAIYTALTTPSAVALNNVVPLGSTIRRFGCNIMQNGNSIALTGSGYYKVDITSVVTGAAGTVTLTVLKDGSAVAGATSSVTSTADGLENVALTTMVRLNCCNEQSNITVVLSGTAATVNSMNVVVQKV